MSTWNGATSVPPTFLPRLPNPQSTLELGSLVLLCGLVAGLAEVSRVHLDWGSEDAELIRVACQAIDVFGLDDNLSLPVLFGLFVWFFMYSASFPSRFEQPQLTVLPRSHRLGRQTLQSTSTLPSVFNARRTPLPLDTHSSRICL